MARRAAGAKRRGATPAIEPRIRDEIGAIAVLAFALLSTVALATDQGAVLQWWRSALFSLLGWAAWLVPLALGAIALELWFGFIRRETVLPILGALVIVVALLGLTRQVTRADAAGGIVGGAVAKAAASLFGSSRSSPRTIASTTVPSSFVTGIAFDVAATSIDRKSASASHVFTSGVSTSAGATSVSGCPRRTP